MTTAERPGAVLTARAASTQPRRLAGQRLSRALVLPDVVLLVVVFVLPALLLVAYSFLRIDLNTKALLLEPTLDNYAQIANPIYLTSVVRSVGVSLVVAATCLVIGLPYAFAMTQVSRTTQMLLLVAVVIPYYTSSVVRSYAWLMLLGPTGFVPTALGAVGLVPPGTDLRYSLLAIALGMVYSYLPLMILPLYVTLERIDPSLLDAAADLGLRPAKRFFRVVVPAALPGIAAGLVLIGIPALGEFTIPAVLGGNKVLLMGNVIVNEFQATGNYPVGSALASVLMGATLALLAGSAAVITVLNRRRALA
jgi:ABC-type spermidine/putrescine transport system permease subunit I